MNRKISKTYLLFESGEGVEVNISLHKPSSATNRPIDAFMVTECDGDCTRSARRAAQAVYDVLSSSENLDRFVVGYDLNGLPSERQVIGGSGGLAFAVSLAKRLTKKDPGPVAATGIVDPGGTVSPIKGIKAKLQAAKSLIPENGFILYPEKNHHEIPDELYKEIKRKGIHLHPVSSISESFEILFKPEKAAEDLVKIKKSKTTPLLFCLLIILILGAGFYIFNSKKEITAQVHTAEKSDPKEKVKKTADQDEQKPQESSSEESKPSTVKKNPAEEKQTEKIPEAVKSVYTGSINIEGKGSLASQISQKVNDLLLSHPDELPEKGQVSGTISVLWINEDTGKDGTVSSSISIVLNGFKTVRDNKESSFPAIRVEEKGQGSVIKMADKASDTMCRKILQIFKTPEKLSDDGGFD